MEDFEQERKDAWNKKIAENTQLIFDTFKKEVEQEGGTMEFVQKYGDNSPKIYISDNISDSLKTKIKDFISRFAPENFWGQ